MCKVVCTILGRLPLSTLHLGRTWCRHVHSLIKNDIRPDLILLMNSKPFFNHILGHKELLGCNIRETTETTGGEGGNTIATV